MLVSRHWLSKFFDTELPDAEKLAEALTFHAFEIESVANDVLDVKVTPNRGHDCLSHRGIARELSAILNIPLTNDPFAEKPKLEPKTEDVALVIEDPALCPRYIAGYIKGVKVGPSPEWLRKNLESIGQRPINNVVDATNFVMFNTGQPLHAFDAGQLKKEEKYEIEVRRAKPNETITTLDEKTYTLKTSMLVIGDKNSGEAIGVAGIKGGKPAGITTDTKDIIIESANFDGVSVRKTAQTLKLRTDASSRFEQVLSPEMAGYGMQLVVELIQKLAGGDLAGFADVYPEPQKESRVSVSLEQTNRVLGSTLTPAEVADVFQRLALPYKEEGGVFEVVVPPERLDLTIPEDLVEEVARIVGYDKILSAPLSPFPKTPEINQNFYAAEKAREELVADGYSEVFTSVFAEEGERAVLNKVDSMRPYLRTSLIPGLEEVLAKNKNNKDLLGLKEVKLFEIGTIWKGGTEVTMLGTISEKEKASEKPLESATTAEKYDISYSLPSSEIKYQPFSKYPYIVRDIALWVPAGTDPDEIAQIINTKAGPLGVKTSLFDRFEKEGKMSLAFHIIFQSFERTLTESEANEAMEKVAQTLRSRGFEIR